MAMLNEITEGQNVEVSHVFLNGKRTELGFVGTVLEVNDLYDVRVSHAGSRETFQVFANDIYFV